MDFDPYLSKSIARDLEDAGVPIDFGFFQFTRAVLGRFSQLFRF